jgi:hypothetical protein
MADTEENNMPFRIKDCSLIVRMAGLREAMNLRELEERLNTCPVECLFHHFCETVIRPTFDDPDYPNDFAQWASRQLRDRVLAERLANINPYKPGSLEDLRKVVLDIIQERLSELDYIPWAPNGNVFHFMQAVTVVFDTGITVDSIKELSNQLPQMTLGSIYYHFVEARRRTDNNVDDFSVWLSDKGESTQPLLKALSEIDFYFLSLTELKQTLIDTVCGFEEEYADA